MFGHTFEAVPDGPPEAYQAFKVGDDVDAGAGRTRELGGDVLREPTDSPYGRSATLTDPQGALFAVIRGNSIGRSSPPANCGWVGRR